MKKILVIFGFLAMATLSQGQAYCQLTQTDTGTINDLIGKEDSLCTNGLKVMTIQQFFAFYLGKYGLGGIARLQDTLSKIASKYSLKGYIPFSDTINGGFTGSTTKIPTAYSLNGLYSSTGLLARRPGGLIVDSNIGPLPPSADTAWYTEGNTNTKPNYNFLGTTSASNEGLMIKTHGIQRARWDTLGFYYGQNIGFTGLIEPYYSSAYQHGTSGQVLTSEGSSTPQWTTISSGSYVPLADSNMYHNGYSSLFGLHDSLTNYIQSSDGWLYKGNFNHDTLGVVGNGYSEYWRFQIGSKTNTNTPCGYISNVDGNGENNTAFGVYAGWQNPIIANQANSFFGSYSGYAWLGIRSTFIGVGNGHYMQYGTSNTSVGVDGLNNAPFNTVRSKPITGNFLCAFGFDALSNGANTSNNTALGAESMAAVMDSIAVNNSAVGFQSLTNLYTGTNNVAMGYQCAINQRSGTYNVYLNCNPGDTSSSENYVAMVGALHANKNGSHNIIIGENNANALLNISNIVSIGPNALVSDVSGTEETVLGNSALYYATGIGNTAVGNLALQGASGFSGTYNTAIGDKAGQAGTALASTGNSNTFLGAYAQTNTPASVNRTALGYNAAVTTDNTVQAGNSAVTTLATYGQLKGYATTPTVTLGTGAGTGATYTDTATNFGMILVVTTAGSPATSAKIATITYPTAFANGSNPIVQPGSGNVPIVSSSLTGAANLWASGSKTQVAININAVALLSPATYIFRIYFNGW